MFTEEEQALIQKVNDLINPSGCAVTGLGPLTVGNQGDARVYEPSVTISVPPEYTETQKSDIAISIVNSVKGIARVLIDIVPV